MTGRSRQRGMSRDSFCLSLIHILKSYSADGIYISDIIVEDNLVTINRVVKSGSVYQATAQDYLTNNEERSQKDVTLEAFTTDLKEKQMRFTFSEEIKELSPKIIRPNHVLKERPITAVSYTHLFC